MASGEVTLDDAFAVPVGELTNGFRQMAEMLNVSRLSNAMRAAALMRRAVLESVEHTRRRPAFGKALFDQPLMRATLLPMITDAEAALGLVLESAARLDDSDAGDQAARSLIRVLTPLAKYKVCKQARGITGEAMEIRGGNGYIEDWVNPRLLRDAHLGSIWEGSSNVIALDVLRCMRRESAHQAVAETYASRLHDIADPDVLDLLVAVSEFAEDLVVVLAERGWRGADPRAVSAVVDRKTHLLELADRGVVDFLDDAERVGVRAGVHLVQGADRGDGDASRLQRRAPVPDGAAAQGRFELGFELVAVDHPVLVGAEAQVVGQFVPAEECAESLPQAVVPDGDDEVSVGRRVRLVRHEARVPRTEPLRSPPGREEPRGPVDVQGELRLVQGGGDGLAPAGAGAFDECGKHSDDAAADGLSVRHARAISNAGTSSAIGRYTTCSEWTFCAESTTIATPTPALTRVSRL
ncbi:acyl-CoA dehydrogenase-like protein [Saccharopolyspora erythraea NRRL 2338]|uniref:Uncharacterized protein n=2 Tax=Saccharopolyspora erythraea TaxID=1836 RepID=A4FIT3_SACEN|nr:acyl-CoA dehydrogenase family protein [Saccharopolyspora erythraea]EQD83078.1 hypothetical protein N599_27165 [Saccharopolyspora erythraea D]PFG97631.1 acyl-CoA dehydrogenase-like protein [Saccharopolyspora erythraea NRRL 2338]QRK87789.1 hypothetical protein JQX30_23865 [Saccharopolyspora erythraea]CAM03958.1 hypothetical protein SACE_4690 [Saccharopolyspora erythraea NRRL 2338]